MRRGNLYDLRDEVVARFMKARMRKLLAESKWNISRAAQRAGIDRRGFFRYMKLFGIEVPTEFRSPHANRPKEVKPDGEV